MNFKTNLFDNLVLKYQDYYETVKKQLSDYRFKHTLGVVRLAIEIANAHNLNVDNAFLAALFHDFTKEWDDDKTIDYLLMKDSSLLGLNIKILHQYTASYYLKENYNFDNEVLIAIENHTLGNSDLALSKLLYVADKYEENRKYDTTYGRSLALSNLDKAFEFAKDEAKKYYGEK